MAQAQGSRHSISYINEVTFGTTPATPAMLELRNTGTTLKVKKDNFVSDEIRNDRQIVDMRHGLKQIAGDINFELGPGYLDDFLEKALAGEWATNVLKVGTTPGYFSIERAFADISEYHQFTGCMVNTMSLNIIPNAMVTGTFGIIGKDGTVASTPLDAAVTAADSDPPFDGFTGSMLEAGGAIATVTALTLSLDNKLDPTFVIGGDTTPGIMMGRSMLTGTMTALFESEILLNKFLNETETSLSATLEGISGWDHTLLMPRIKYTAGDVDVSNADDGLLINMPWQALRDSTEATNLKITRTAV